MKLHPRANWYRDVWLLAITVVVLLALKAGANNTNEIQEGRVTGTQISCGINQATLRANQRVIESSGTPQETPAQERTLERLGFGNKATREAQARSLGATYVEFVKHEIVNFAGPSARDVIELVPSGKPRPHKPMAHLARVNCGKLRSLTKIH